MNVVGGKRGGCTRMSAHMKLCEQKNYIDVHCNNSRNKLSAVNVFIFSKCILVDLAIFALLWRISTCMRALVVISIEYIFMVELVN